MKHAYLIMAHNNFYNLEKLLKMLDDDRNNIFLHFDKKTKNIDKSYYDRIVLKAKLYIFQDISVNWGGFSQVQCELFLLKKAMDVEEHQVYHLLSAADLPIKTQDEIHDFFMKHQNKQFIQIDKKRFEKEKKSIIMRIKYYHPIQEIRKCVPNKMVQFVLTFFAKFLLAFQMLMKIDRLKNIKMDVTFGSQWFSITHSFAEYVIEKEKDIYNLFHKSQAPDELFMQMLAWNSKYREELHYDEEKESYDNMREIEWQYETDNSHPKTFKVDDFERIKKSGALFARKFMDDCDRDIIDLLYEKYGD